MVKKSTMADNKANALQSTESKYQLKVYYDGRTPEESGQTTTHVDVLDSSHRPWLFKYYTKDGVCHQYADTVGVYRGITNRLSNILDAVIVNAKQRAAVDKIIDNTLWEYLGRDMAGEKDSILDPCEY